MNRILITLTLLTSTCLFSFAQNNTRQVIQSSYQKINVGKAKDAIADLDKLIADNPDHQAALTALGFAYRTIKDYPKSAEVYEKALDVNPKSNIATFNLGVAYALSGQIDDSFRTLLPLKNKKGFNITNVGLSPAANLLKSDSRYRDLFPSQVQYANPFVEKGVKIIHDWGGENASDQFGWIGRNIGDVNGDGVMDLVSSAPTNNEGGRQAGKVYVYSGEGGELLWSYSSKDPSGQLGMSVEAAGDVNGDGIPDVIAGAPYVNKVFVFSGNNGEVLFEWEGADAKSAFGRGVKGVGDVNKDGFGDLLIGAPYQIWGAPLNSSQIESPGSVFLYSGKDGDIIQTWHGLKKGDGFGTAIGGKTVDEKTTLMIGAPGAGPRNAGQVDVYRGMQAESGFTISADSTSTNLGAMFMSVVGDVDGDNIQDVYASDFSNSALGPATGRAYIHSGATGKVIYALTGERAGDGFGIGVADAGDVNKDGYDDMVIGAWQHASAAASGGKVYVYSGKDGSLLRSITGNVVGETLGFDTTGIGDVDGDGVIDLLLTSAWSGINGSQSGRMLIISGKQ